MESYYKRSFVAVQRCAAFPADTALCRGGEGLKQTEKDRLRVLLDYWVKHNKEHAEEFREWAEKAKGSGEDALSKELMAAATEMGKANAFLARALLGILEK